MELDDVAPRDGTSRKLLPAVIAEDSFDKIVAQHRIAKASLLFNRHHGEPLHEGTRKESSAVTARHPVPIEDPHPMDAAARRVFLENVSGKIFQGWEPVGGHALKRLRMILRALDCNEPRMMRIADQPHRFAGRSQSGFDLRTNRDPLHIAAEDVCQELVTLMAAIESHFVPQKAAADSQAKEGGCHRMTCRLPRARYSSRA